MAAPDWLKKHRGVEADAAAADNRHLRANRRFIAQDIKVAQHFWMIDPIDRRQARGDTGGEDRLIERQQIVCRDAGVQA